MAEHSCCHAIVHPKIGQTKTRRVLGSTKWIVPTTVLVLLPKCPMCVAAYIALATGITVSLSAATWIRTGLLAACLCTLTYLSLRLAARALNRRRLSP